jgi:hypothetical protein
LLLKSTLFMIRAVTTSVKRGYEKARKRSSQKLAWFTIVGAEGRGNSTSALPGDSLENVGSVMNRELSLSTEMHTSAIMIPPSTKLDNAS